MDAYLRFLHDHYPEAFDAMLAGDVAGFSHGLKQRGYYTADEATYTGKLQSVFNQNAANVPAEYGIRVGKQRRADLRGCDRIRREVVVGEQGEKGDAMKSSTVDFGVQFPGAIEPGRTAHVACNPPVPVRLVSLHCDRETARYFVVNAVTSGVRSLILGAAIAASERGIILDSATVIPGVGAYLSVTYDRPGKEPIKPCFHFRVRVVTGPSKKERDLYLTEIKNQRDRVNELLNDERAVGEDRSRLLARLQELDKLCAPGLVGFGGETLGSFGGW